jgi:hypothetical protein
MNSSGQDVSGDDCQEVDRQLEEQQLDEIANRGEVALCEEVEQYKDNRGPQKRGEVGQGEFTLRAQHDIPEGEASSIQAPYHEAENGKERSDRGLNSDLIDRSERAVNAKADTNRSDVYERQGKAVQAKAESSHSAICG